MARTLLCRKCGCDMTPRENRQGYGFCFVCAAIYSPDVSRRRPMDEAIREIYAEGSD